MPTHLTSSEEHPEFVFRRTLSAPRELVFRMWTEREHVARWQRPQVFAQVDIEEMNARVGGELRMKMVTPTGLVYTSKSIYREVSPPARLVYEERCWEAGQLFHLALVQIDLVEAGDKTELTVRARLDLIPDRNPLWTIEAMREGWTTGWKGNVDQLEEYLAAGVLASA